MKILFIKPNNLSDHIQPSLGYGYLAAQIRGDHDVVIHDCIKENTPPGRVADLVEFHNPDVIGFQCYTFDVPKVSRMVKAIKERFPDKIIVVGGAHVSSVPREAFEQLSPYVDFAVQGEGEIGFPKFLAALEKKERSFEDIEGLVWRNPGGEVVCNRSVWIENLDDLGSPEWDLLRPESYPEAQHGAFYEQFPIAPLITTRGCPYACTFCSAPIISGKRLRHHSVEYVQRQVLDLYRRGVREIHIVDDNFTFDLDYCKQVLRGIIALDLGISLATPNGVRMDRLDDEVLELMKEAGQYLVTVAVESGSDRILQKMKKATTVAKIRSNIALIQKHGFPVAAFFILGYPGETKADIEETIRFSQELGLARANFFTYLPLPGTSSYNELVQSGEIKGVDWNTFYFMTAPYTPQGMTRRELLGFKRKAFLTFYLNPKVLLANVLAVKSFRHFLFLLKRFYHWILMRPAAVTVGIGD